MRRVMWWMVILAASTTAAAAQGGRYGYAATPRYYVGLSYGYLGGTTIGSRAATWQFGYTSQIRATVEKVLQRGFTGGISAGFANAPLTYTNESGAVDVGGACGGVCDANADVTQVLAFVLGGGTGVGFHTLYNLEAGITEFSNFREASTGQSLGSGRTGDFTFGLGGGLAFGLSPLADVYVSEQGDFILDQQPQQVGHNQNAPRQFTFRAGFRYGF